MREWREKKQHEIVSSSAIPQNERLYLTLFNAKKYM